MREFIFLDSQSDVSEDRGCVREMSALVTRCTPVSRAHFAFITNPAPLCLRDKIGGERARTRANRLSGKLVSGEIKLGAP